MCARARVRACALATLWRHFLGHMMSPLNCEVSCAQARACVRGRGADLARKVSPHVKPGRAWDSADCGDVHGRASPQSGEWSRGASWLLDNSTPSLSTNRAKTKGIYPKENKQGRDSPNCRSFLQSVLNRKSVKDKRELSLFLGESHPRTRINK